MGNTSLDEKLESVSIEEAIQYLTKSYLTSIQKNRQPMPHMFWGPPGIGKTFGVYEAAHRLEKALNCEVPVRCLLTSSMDPCDVSGVPFESKIDPNYCEYKPLDWAYHGSTLDTVKNQGPMILFFDDMPAAHQQTQSAFFKVVHEHMVGHLKLRDNVMIVAAGNRPEDNAGANAMVTAMGSRFRHYTALVDSDVWLRWAVKQGGINPLVIGYIRQNRDHLHIFDADKVTKTFPCPRTWEFVSEALDEWDAHDPMLARCVTGTVGNGVTPTFMAFLDRSRNSIPPEVIIKDPHNAKVPDSRNELDILHATVASLVKYINEKPKYWKEGMIYAVRKDMMDELGAVLAADLVEIIYTFTKDLKNKATSDPVFLEMFQRYGDHLAG